MPLSDRLRRYADESWPYAMAVSNTGNPETDNNFGKAASAMREAADYIDANLATRVKVSDEDVERACQTIFPMTWEIVSKDDNNPRRENVRAALESDRQRVAASVTGHCNICGGSVDLSKATRPAVDHIFVGARGHTERARPTENMIAAVELVMAMGFKWIDGKWNPSPQSEVSCMLCGYVKEPGIYHSLLPSAYTCRECQQALLAQRGQSREGCKWVPVDVLEDCVADACNYTQSDEGWAEYGRKRDALRDKYKAMLAAAPGADGEGNGDG